MISHELRLELAPAASGLAADRTQQSGRRIIRRACRRRWRHATCLRQAPAGARLHEGDDEPVAITAAAASAVPWLASPRLVTAARVVRPVCDGLGKRPPAVDKLEATAREQVGARAHRVVLCAAAVELWRAAAADAILPLPSTTQPDAQPRSTPSAADQEKARVLRSAAARASSSRAAATRRPRGPRVRPARHYAQLSEVTEPKMLVVLHDEHLTRPRVERARARSGAEVRERNGDLNPLRVRARGHEGEPCGLDRRGSHCGHAVRAHARGEQRADSRAHARKRGRGGV
eukprot:CAMPEP_0180009690 /NCGR_PEP_ID=MMETSP0984-20121128/15286_1 /TAXON_ID=483367 /ORGANISM="non described non described, Strain CCMP 2436" /LENGTH=288 /DNA_ID=CAMNT_0021931331 /DNA_START=323 /DNA_END=1186 /DNA_ORIENTATION=+